RLGLAMKQLKDKVILVTGEGGGVGRDIALCAARNGAKVIVKDIGASLTGEGNDTTRAQEVVDLIRSEGGEAIASGDSIAEAESAQEIIADAIAAFGRIDGAIHS